MIATIHHLLTHTGGTGDYFGPGYDAQRMKLRTHDDYVRLYGKRELEFEPGSEWRYSNFGFILLGAVIEAVSGQSYYEYVEEHVYEPAGMTASGSPPEKQADPDRAIGYWKPPEATGAADGGGYSTVEDLARFLHALLSHKLLSPDSTELMMTGKVQFVPEDPSARYAYGIFDLRDADGNGFIGHPGGSQGVNGDLRAYPKSGYVVAALPNLDGVGAQRVADFLDPRPPSDP